MKKISPRSVGAAARSYLANPTPRETLIRTLGLAGIVLIVGGTAIGLRSSGAFESHELGAGPRPDRGISLFVTDLRAEPGAENNATETLLVRFEGAFAANYPRMDASEIDAKFAVFGRPKPGDCCWQPRRISWHDDAANAEIALPIAFAPTVAHDAENVNFPSISRVGISHDQADALRPMLLSHEPMVATVDVGTPDDPRLYDLRPASDAEIAAHERARTVADRP